MKKKRHYQKKDLEKTENNKNQGFQNLKKKRLKG